MYQLKEIVVAVKDVEKADYSRLELNSWSPSDKCTLSGIEKGKMFQNEPSKGVLYIYTVCGEGGA